jgi:putative endonuclease
MDKKFEQTQKTDALKRGASNKEKGDSAELAAAYFLRRKGYEILRANYRTKEGEVDIIAKDGETTVFAEVKYRSNESRGTPAEAVTKAKERKIIKAATAYAVENQILDSSLRFDVIEVRGNKLLSFNHIENAFILQ